MSKLLDLGTYLAARLQESSTWAVLFAIAGFTNLSVSSILATQITEIGMAVSGLLGVLLRERGGLNIADVAPAITGVIDAVKDAESKGKTLTPTEAVQVAKGATS